MGPEPLSTLNLAWDEDLLLQWGRVGYSPAPRCEKDASFIEDANLHLGNAKAAMDSELSRHSTWAVSRRLVNRAH